MTSVYMAGQTVEVQFGEDTSEAQRQRILSETARTGAEAAAATVTAATDTIEQMGALTIVDGAVQASGYTGDMATAVLNGSTVSNTGWIVHTGQPLDYGILDKIEWKPPVATSKTVEFGLFWLDGTTYKLYDRCSFTTTSTALQTKLYAEHGMKMMPGVVTYPAFLSDSADVGVILPAPNGAAKLIGGTSASPDFLASAGVANTGLFAVKFTSTPKLNAKNAEIAALQESLQVYDDLELGAVDLSTATGPVNTTNYRIPNRSYPLGGKLDTVDVRMNGTGTPVIYTYNADKTVYGSVSLGSLAAGTYTAQAVNLTIPVGGWVGVYVQGVAINSGATQWADGVFTATAAGGPYSLVTTGSPALVTFNTREAVGSGATALDARTTAVAARVTALENGATAAWDDIQLLDQISHLMIYGQSLSIGRDSHPVLSTTAAPGGLRFIGGVRAQDAGTTAAVKYTSLQPLIETFSVNWGETFASGAVLMIGQILLSERGVDIATMGQRFLCSAPGEGGTSALGLSEGSTYFTRLKEDITYGRTRALDDATYATKTYGVGALLFKQGEKDYSDNNTRANWRSAVIGGIWNPLMAHAAAVTGQSRQIPLLISQTGGHPYYSRTVPNIALEQALMAAELDYCHCLADWHMTRAADGLHFSAAGSKTCGAYFGLLIYRWLIDGVKPPVFQPTRVDRNGDTLIATYPVAAGRKLVLEDATAFTIGDDAGVDRAATSVALVGHNKVAVTYTGVAGMTNPTLRHGWPADQVATGVARGGIRDNAGDDLVFEPSGLNVPMHTYGLISETAVTS